MVTTARIATENKCFNRINQGHRYVPCLIYGSIGLRESASPLNGIAVGSAVFAWLTRVTNIDTHADHTTLRRDMRKYSPHLALLAALAMRANGTNNQ